MSFVEELIARGEGKPRRVIEIEHVGHVLKFSLPKGGLERATFRRNKERFVQEMTTQPNAIFVQKGLVPEGGYPEEEATAVFMLHSLSADGWSQETVLKMLASNYDETLQIAGAVSEIMLKHQKEDAELEMQEKKGSLKDSDYLSNGLEQA